MAKVKIKKIPGYKKGGLTNHGIGYYNPYLEEPKPNFEDIFPVDVKINSTVKEVPDEVATIEAEKGEVIVQPGLEGIYRILGKTHKNGGTKLNPQPGSFIFSNDKKLAITKDEKQLFDFKEGGVISKSTPAMILEKEIDLKEYNRYQSILKNPKAEKIERATAQLMVSKYQKTIGQIAYLQEMKKEANVPEFAMGTAPMKTQELIDKEEQQEMYKHGGLIKMAFGDEFCPCGKDPVTKECLECSDEVYSNLMKSKAKKVGTPTTGYDPLYTDKDGKRLYGKFGETKGTPGKGSPDFNKAFGLARKQGLSSFTWNGKTYNTNIYKPGKDTEDYQYTEPNKVLTTPPTLNTKPGIPVLNPPQFLDTPPAGMKPNKPEVDSTPGNLPYNIKGYLTDQEKAHLGYLGLQAMSVKRYMPKRDQIDLDRVSLDKVNLQPYLTGIQGQQFQAYNSANVVNPRQASLLGSNILGKGFDAEVGARAQVDSSNIQIGNQENLTNLQQSNQEQMFNIPASGKYYDSTILSKQNFDDERRFANNQVMSTMNKYQSDADELAWSLASVNKYGTRKVVDPKTGKVYNQPVPLYEQTHSGIKYNADVASLNMATGADKANSISEIKTIMEQFGLNTSDPKQIYAFSKLYDSITGRGKNPVYQNNPTYPAQ